MPRPYKKHSSPPPLLPPPSPSPPPPSPHKPPPLSPKPLDACAAEGYIGPAAHTEVDTSGSANLDHLDASPLDCCVACTSHASGACRGFVIYRGTCYLKSGELTPRRKEGRTAYYHMTPPPPPGRSGRSRSHDDIDAVVTWADSTDPAWQARYEAVVGRKFKTGLRYTPTSAGPETELSIALEKIRENLPWIRTIYVLTQRPQSPSCVDTIPNAKVVFHDEVGVPAVFNSLAIETSLHPIPGLSKTFLYLNDDFYVLRRLTRDVFFRHAYWMPIVRFDKSFGHSPLYAGFASSNRRTLNAMGLTTMIAALSHWPYALTHAMMEDARQQLGTAWNRTRDCPVRYACDDVSTVLAALAKGLTEGTAIDDPLLRKTYPNAYLSHAERPKSQLAMVVINELDVDEATLRALLGARHCAGC